MLTTAAIERLCNQEHERFWDQDGLIPAIGALANRFDTNMANALIRNILDRQRGDWEIETATKVLKQISQTKLDQKGVKACLRAYFSVQDHLSEGNRNEIEHYLFVLQDRDMLMNCVNDALDQQNADSLPSLKDALALLFHFCCYFDICSCMDLPCLVNVLVN